MIPRLSFAFIAIFWVVMNGLLWHSEFGAGHDLASALPAEVVWKKILTAPDDSNLSIAYDRKKIGYLRWRPATGEDPKGKVINESEPEGMVRALKTYRVEVEGSFVLSALAKSIRFTADMDLNRNLAWQRFQVQATTKPSVWKIKGDGREKALWIEAGEGGNEWTHRIGFDELAHPQQLLSGLDDPALATLLPQLPANATDLHLGLEWEARHDWIKMGGERIRIYRLEGRLIEGYRIVLLISRVGEILKVDLPGSITLANDTLFPGP